jgi:hypothetical protein|tara:strand:- start:2385 stop:2672 length:288 start_codon:yes stop_codon:yes gene_type:complete
MRAFLRERRTDAMTLRNRLQGLFNDDEFKKAFNTKDFGWLVQDTKNALDVVVGGLSFFAAWATGDARLMDDDENTLFNEVVQKRLDDLKKKGQHE